MTIELDKKVLSPRYFPVVIYAMYTDEVIKLAISVGYYFKLRSHYSS